MKKLLLLLFLPFVAQAQWSYSDTLACSDTTVSKNFYGVTSLPEDAYQTWVTVVATGDAVDSIKVQQRLTWGKGPTLDSAWFTMRLYTPTRDTIMVLTDTLAITKKLPNTSVTATQFLVWSPFMGDRWRIVRNSPAGYKPSHVLYWKIRNRYWSSR